VKEWKEKGEGRPSAVFACNVEHSIHLRDAFIAAGVPAAHIDAETNQADREDVFAGLESGRLKVVCNVGIVTTGVDLPFLSCLSMAFATASLSKYLQVAGRVLRTCDGKADAVMIDHGGNIYRHGWPTEDHEWKLNPETTVEEWDKEATDKKAKQLEMIACSNCGAMRRGGGKCPHCNHGAVRNGQAILFEDGTLREIEHKQAAKEVSDGERLWKQCLGIAANRGGSVTMARVMFKQKSGDWPDALDTTPRNKQSCKVADLYPGFCRRRSA
jgi:DNA repair protein RadD